MDRLTGYSLAIIFALTLLNSPTVCGQDQSAQNKQEPSDNDIAAAIKADIADASRIAGGVINVDVNTGLVTLSGTATSSFDKQMSAKIAKRTRCVKAVLNQLIVLVSDRRDDDIRSDVEKVLRINDSVDKPRIAVDVSRGEVAMTGKVESLAEKQIMRHEMREALAAFDRSTLRLFFSGLSAGLEIGFSLFLMAVVQTLVQDELPHAISTLLIANMYSFGFILVILKQRLPTLGTFCCGQLSAMRLEAQCF